MGKGKDTTSNNDISSTQPRPLASLRDPKTFEPPPKHKYTAPKPSGLGDTNYSLRSENGISGKAASQFSSKSTNGAGGQGTVNAAVHNTAPYSANTTGLDASHFPKPPTRNDLRTASIRPAERYPPSTPKPGLPPRLPPRQTEGSAISLSGSNSPMSPTKLPGQLNEGAIDRLGKSGISIPDFGIGSNHSSDKALPTASSGLTSSGLQSKFAKIGMTESGNTGTSTPSQPSISQVRDTAITAKSINDRHGDQIALGLRSAQNLDEKYDIANKVNDASSNGTTQGPARSLSTTNKKPPPPIPSKAALSSRINNPPP